MINIINKQFYDTDGLNNYWFVVFEIDGLQSKTLVELPSNTSNQDILDYLNARESEILVRAKQQNIQVINKKLEVIKEVEATDFLVKSPVITNDLVRVRQDITKEVSKNKKSIAFLALAYEKIISDLITRVEKLEK